MIRVTVELISAVDPARNKVLGVAKIVNTGSGTLTHGDYHVILSKVGGKRTWRAGDVQGFPRIRLGGWDLLFCALRSCVGDRNKEEPCQ